jgi:hypothetical protein
MKGYAHLALVLVLLQGGTTLLAMLGELVVMGGNPLYLPVALAHAALVIVAGAAIRRVWGAIVLLVLECFSVLGFWLSVLVGLLPWVVYPVNLVGLLTNLLIPGTLALLAIRSLADRGAKVLTA